MRLKKHLQHLFISGFACILISPSAYAQNSLDAFINSLDQAYDLIQEYEYTKAIAHMNSAEILYHRTLQELAKSGETSSSIWKSNLAMQGSMVRLYLTLGNRLFDQDNYTKALQIYQRAQDMAPRFPCIRYEKGYTYFKLNQPWKAAVELYEAKRLARFPSYRKIVNHFDEEETIVCPQREVEERGNGILKDLGKSPLYPIELNLSTGQPASNQILPGVGIHLAKQKQSIYLEETFTDVLTKVGPAAGEEETTHKGQNLRLYVYPEMVIAVDPSDDSIVQIHAFDNQRPVNTPNGMLRIGDHARDVLKTMGQGYGFSRNYNGINEDIREYLDYSELGLMFGIGKNDRIKTIAIYTLE